MRDKRDKTYYLVIARDTGHDGKPHCVLCNAIADDVHEIIPRSSFSKSDLSLFDISNRCCLCRKCHEKSQSDNARTVLLRILKARHGYEYGGIAKCLLEGSGVGS